MILDQIVKSTKVRVAEGKKKVSLETLKAQVVPSQQPFAFEKALKKEGMSFICEVKKASPSKGIIAEDFPYVDIAKAYEAAGADCISVLTEPEFFLGDNQFLKEIKAQVTIPVIRKDFTVDEYQIYEARALGADAILLICAILDEATLRKFIKLADDLGMSALVEAHDAQEVEKALLAGARVVGVNNRNLKTFEVNIQNSISLRALVPKSCVFIAESGIRTYEDIRELSQNGTDGVLIGETLMRRSDKKEALDELKGFNQKILNQ